MFKLGSGDGKRVLAQGRPSKAGNQLVLLRFHLLVTQLHVVPVFLSLAKSYGGPWSIFASRRRLRNYFAEV